MSLSHNAHGHWIGDASTADNVLIWYHGGGFSLPANMGYFEFFARIVDDMSAQGKSVAVFSLSYTLAPHGPYPTQLRQAVECLRYVLQQNERAPRSVFLGGDSAGGNLVGGVLSHLAHPHPDIEPLVVKQNLGGAVMIAPWTLLDAEFPDRIIYSGGDIITEDVAGPWAKAYIADGKRDYYTDLSTAPADWYETFPVEKVLVTGGENEILLPVIEDFAQKFKVRLTGLESLSTGADGCRTGSRVKSSCLLGSASAMLRRCITSIWGTRGRQSRGSASSSGCGSCFRYDVPWIPRQYILL